MTGIFPLEQGLGRRAFLAGSAAVCGLGAIDGVRGAVANEQANRMKHWYPNFQARDIDIIDYHDFAIAGCDARFRGPAFDPFAADRDSFFTCIGGAQTFGPFCEEPFPTLLAQRTGLKALNLGMGGASPGFFLINPSLIEAANRGQFVVLQAMAARQESNSRFASDGHVEFVRDRIKGDSVDSGTAWARLVNEDFENLPKYVSETRATWLEEMRQLTAALTVPVIFFWFARRQPDYRIDWDALRILKENGAPAGQITEAIFADAPHLIDSLTAKAAAGLCSGEAACLSDRGMGAVLINRHTGLPINPEDYRNRGVEYHTLLSGRNFYYPSAEMHQDAADALGPLVKRLKIA